MTTTKHHDCYTDSRTFLSLHLDEKVRHIVHMPLELAASMRTLIALAAIAPLFVTVALCNEYVARMLHPSAGFGYSSGIGISGESQVGGGAGHALLWAGSAESFVDLHPSGFNNTEATDAFGDIQVGWGAVGPQEYRALLWNGTAESVVDLTPAGFTVAYANGIGSESQVGSGSGPATGLKSHALLWKGSVESVVDLHPAGYEHSAAMDTSGNRQVGIGFSNLMGSEKALMWSSTASSVVSLHPASFSSSVARGLDATHQVGEGVSNMAMQEHALLWSGTAESVVDLHPAGFVSSRATDVIDGVQIGYGSPGDSVYHALLWKGSAESVVDLHGYLAGLPIFMTRSYAMGINSDGTIVGYGQDTNATPYAVMWLPIPEPSVGNLALLGAGGLLVLRFRVFGH